MCPPKNFVVEYAINAWMDTTVPVDTELAVKQWHGLRETLQQLGHDVHVLASEIGLPDMVYAANGAFTVDGAAYGARFRFPQRTAEEAAHKRFYAAALTSPWRFVSPSFVNEGEGDFAYLPAAYGGLILAGHGFRTDALAHSEAQDALGRPVVSLRLVDPRFYHLDTALCVLDADTAMYYPAAFDDAGRAALAARFAELIEAKDEDAEVLGLNAVSDGRHVVLPVQAAGLAAQLSERGFEPVGVDVSELLKGGGGPKCCTLELRP